MEKGNNIKAMVCIGFCGLVLMVLFFKIIF